MEKELERVKGRWYPGFEAVSTLGSNDGGLDEVVAVGLDRYQSGEICPLPLQSVLSTVAGDLP